MGPLTFLSQERPHKRMKERGLVDSASANLQHRARAGDQIAFEALLAPLLESGFAVAVAILGDRTDAEDAVQEAAVKMWRNFNQFRIGEDPRPWFLAIVSNQSRSMRRSHWWRARRQLNAEPFEVAAAAGTDWSERVDLRSALAKLPRKHLLVLVLYFHLDLPIDEIASVIGCSPAATRQRIHRAVLALRPSMTLELNP